jgi:ATPase subunit of ABC transporter with duplicated ATPase domains
MISTSNITLQYGKRVLFENVSIKFSPGNCYGIIGANGAGKSTFLKILSGEIEAQAGQVSLTPGERISVLRQNQNQFDALPVLKTVIMGNEKLFSIMDEKDSLYAKADFSDADGLRASELEMEFAEMNGWNAETDASGLLSNLGIPEEKHHDLMTSLSGPEKVRVLLAQALFGNPDILLLDEPTNNLDAETILWLEDFLAEFRNTVIVVSHDRHFLDAVCTHICDIDFQKITIYTGNYSFWYESSQLALRQKQDANKKADDKKKELENFIARFSANASKSRQATSRKKLLDKLVFEEIKPSSRKYPYINFKPKQDLRGQILEIKNLKKKLNGTEMFMNFSMTVDAGDKIGLLCSNGSIITLLMDLLAGKVMPDSGEIKWGGTAVLSLFEKNHDHFFTDDISLVSWLSQYTENKEEAYVRGFLGRMLFSGEESLKKAKVLSGGEKVRCMFSKLMCEGSNVLLLDQPTNHLDLESITSLNQALTEFNGSLFLHTHDHQLLQTTANRIIEIFPGGIIDKRMSYDEYILDEKIKNMRAGMMEYEVEAKS